jgi:hypothetical protein
MSVSHSQQAENSCQTSFLPYNGWMVLFHGQMQRSLNKKHCKIIKNEDYFVRDNSDVDKYNCGQIDLLTKLKNDILSDILQIYCVAGKVRLYTDKNGGNNLYTRSNNEIPKGSGAKS